MIQKQLPKEKHFELEGLIARALEDKKAKIQVLEALTKYIRQGYDIKQYWEKYRLML